MKKLMLFVIITWSFLGADAQNNRVCVPGGKWNNCNIPQSSTYYPHMADLDSLLNAWITAGAPVTTDASGTFVASDSITHAILDSALFTNNPDIVGAPLQSVFKSTLNPQYNVFYDASNDADYYAEFYLELTKVNTTLLRTIAFFLQTNTAYPANGNSTFLDTAGLSVFQDRTGASLFADPTTTKSWFYDPSGDDNYLDEIRLNTQSIDSSTKVCASNLNNISNQTTSIAQNTRKPYVISAACTTGVSFTVPTHSIILGGINAANAAQTVSVFGSVNSYDALMINGTAKPSDFNPNFPPLSTVTTHSITPTFTGFIFYIQ